MNKTTAPTMIAAEDATDRMRERAARIEDAARRVLTVLDTYGEGNFAEVDDLREALDAVE